MPDITDGIRIAVDRINEGKFNVSIVTQEVIGRTLGREEANINLCVFLDDDVMLEKDYTDSDQLIDDLTIIENFNQLIDSAD